ncbi:hypothetical protein SNE25_24410 [Mucilaginibacter sabulilitoris]|uniref:TIR domain-containing protein n=1 Tax=Mucilaginibacter sabulilitoris TaxID=1173583 RepID=A0ABZ0TH03_9SPHI|nr:hypothetical protein [Mucilaginibacter sabulilitoris]WPU92475.1 hypothetical protein SNE25_24410 [Mucilaginibacter sabulilitoris]
MEDKDKFLGCYVSYPSLVYGASEEEKKMARDQGDLFSTYVWDKNGISDTLQKLRNETYGKDLAIILFQFYVKPIPYLLQNLKEIENYRKNEKSIGIPIIVTDENFFNKSELDRRAFLKQAILTKLELLAEVVKKKKLDTNIALLKADVAKMLM